MWKEILKVQPSNVREFNEIMSNTLDYVKALPVTKLQALIKRGIVKEIENPKEEYKYQVLRGKENFMIDDIPIRLFFDETLLSGGEEYVFEVTDEAGTYDMNLYAQFDFDDRSNITSKERQKIIDGAKKFMKMSPESIIEAILRS